MFFELSGEWLGIVLIEKSQLSESDKHHVKTVTWKVTDRHGQLNGINLKT